MPTITHFATGFGLLAADIRTLPPGVGVAVGFGPIVAFEFGLGLAPVPVGFVAVPAGVPIGGFGRLAGLMRGVPFARGFDAPVTVDGFFGRPPAGDAGFGAP